MVRVLASWSLIGWATSVLSVQRLVSALVDHERNVQSLYRCTHRYPRAAGGQETLLSVAGLLGAYVCTKLDTTQSLREWEYFWHEH